jgi:8-oxo-dGTP diphosphatase
MPLKWEFPGGKVRRGESPEACLRRELSEELGIDVEVGEIFHVVHHPYPEGAVLLLAYRCRWMAGEILLREHAACRWILPRGALKLDLAEADRPIARKLMDRRLESMGGGPEGVMGCGGNRKPP